MRDEDGAEYFYDNEAITQPAKGILRMWRKREFQSQSAQKEIVTLDEIDCVKGQYRTLGLRVTRWDGRVEISEKPTSWSRVYENSVEEYLIHEHCASGPAH